MEVKCKVCGTINDSENKFCKGCFIPLHKTMEEWTKSIEEKINEELENKISDETTLLDPVDMNIWENIPLEKDEVQKLTPDNKMEEDKTTNILELTPVDELKPEEASNEELDETIRINTPISSKEIDDIKSDLNDLSIINNKEINQNVESAFALAFKFNLIFIILTGIFTYFYGIKIDTNQDIVYSALATFLISGFATILTFRTKYPSNQDVTPTLMIIFTTIILFECASRSILLYNAGIKYLYYYIFVYVIYILIAIVTINAINRFIRANNKEYNSNFISKLNSFGLAVALILIIVGGIAKNNNYEVIKKTTDDTNVSYELPVELTNYITNINDKISENINNDSSYKIPELITDKHFVDTDLSIESVSLSIDDYGTVSSGEIKYNGTIYRYKY